MADSSKEGYSDDDDYDDDYDGENEDEDGNEYGDDGDNDGDGGDDDDDDDDRIQPGNQIAKSSVPDEDHLVDVGRIQFGSQMVDVKMHNSVPIIAIKTRSTLNEYSIIERLRHANIVGFDHAVAAGRIRESQIDYWLYILRPPVFATVSSVNAEYAWSPSDVRRVCDGMVGGLGYLASCNFSRGKLTGDDLLLTEGGIKIANIHLCRYVTPTGAVAEAREATSTTTAARTMGAAGRVRGARVMGEVGMMEEVRRMGGIGEMGMTGDAGMKRATRMIEGTHATSALKVVEALTAINEAKITTATKLANAARATKRLEAEAAEAEAAEAEAAAANRITSADKVEDLRSVGQILEECLVGRGRASEGKNAEWYAFYEATMQEVTFEEYRRKIADILPRYWPAPKGGHGETAHDNWFHNMVFLCCQWGSQNVYFH